MQKQEISDDLRALFAKLDTLGRDKVAGASFVELEFSSADTPARRDNWKETAWLISENKESIAVLKDDLLPWTYQKGGTTTVPSSWQPTLVMLKSITKASFEDFCDKSGKPQTKRPDEGMLRGPGPSHNLLIAHAAWKRGLSHYCVPILAKAPGYEDDFAQYRTSALEDLAWLHYLRAVNLLMYADRQEVVPHLEIISRVSPEGKYASGTKELLDQLRRLIAEGGKNVARLKDESRLTDVEKAEMYVAQLKDIRCPQISQPGEIVRYLAIKDGKPDQNPPTLKLKQLGIAAVPVLVRALEDDTPTRTVYHWRDFSQSRLVWRVSDFAWAILRDISQREFGYRPVVGFTLSHLKPEEKRQVIEEIQKWHVANKTLSPEDRKLAFFSSRNPKDWLTAGNYFLGKKDPRAVGLLLEKIPQAPSFSRGDLCELVAKFGDPQALPTIKQVMETAPEHADRLDAAMALWTLGDSSGIPIVIKYVKAEPQPYGRWDEPIWFLMKIRSKEGMEALTSLVAHAPVERAGDVVESILASVTGDLWSKRRDPAGCVEVCAVLAAAMDRADYTEMTINDVKMRVKDTAAHAFALMKEGAKDSFRGRFAEPSRTLFNRLEPDVAKRDAQITALKQWYEQNKEHLTWDPKKGRLALKDNKPDASH
jgi:hypothetical protein